MERIVAAHYPDLRSDLAREALNVFFQIRDVPGLKKKPATSELLDWLKLLMVDDLPAEVLRSKETHVVIPPLHGALLKNEQDVHLFERIAFLARRGER
jgi:MoxR-like ATPase